jgi:uncharacterized membrane protein
MTSLTPPLLLKSLYKARKVRGHVFVLRVSILPLSTIFLLDYGTVPTVCYFVVFYFYDFIDPLISVSVKQFDSIEFSQCLSAPCQLLV